MKKILTFIIPSYNVEDYLSKCLDSFQAPSVMDKIEVLIINDGSLDKTAEIAQQYVNDHPDMYRLITKENAGHGSTVNVGSLAATGKYFKVVDADDWVITEHLETFICFLEGCDAEVVLTPFHMVDMKHGDRIIQKIYIQEQFRSYTPYEISENWKAFDQCTVFHGITYRTEFYNHYRHELPEHVFYEDQEYATIPFCHAGQIAVLDLTIYQYLIGNAEQSVSSKNQIARIHHLEQVIFHSIQYRNGHLYAPSFSDHYWMQKMTGIVLSYYVIMCIKNPDKRNGRKMCRKLNQKLDIECPGLYKNLRKMYYGYLLFSCLHISYEKYNTVIHSSLFCLLRGNHKIEKL